MSKKIDQIINDLKTLTLLESTELVKQIEKIFNVDTSNKVNANNLIKSETVEIKKPEEKTEFSVILEEVPKNKKIAILKIIRSLTQLGLKEAKLLVESVPQSVQKSVTKEVANDIKKQLEDVGAKVSLT